jgi:RNA polymerase sigma factor (sigma-70 family)
MKPSADPGVDLDEAFRLHSAELLRVAAFILGDRGAAEEAALLGEDRKRVLATLATLPRRRREVLVLRFYLEMSEAEIARTLGISPGSVKSTAARGLAALARQLREAP